MLTTKTTTIAVVLVAFAMFLFGGATSVFAHCDTLDGPVIQAAKLALERGDVTPVLKWVKKPQEAELREAFKKTLDVRTKAPEAKELADMYFFETLVRVHRAGEGAPYTGLKPAGAVEPTVAAADKSLETGSVEELSTEIANAVREGIQKRFAEALEKKKHADESVEAGREFVEAYVQYVHFVEGIHNMVAKGAGPHGHAKKHEH